MKKMDKDPISILKSLKEYRSLSQDSQDIIEDAIYESLAQFSDFGLQKIPNSVLKEEMAESLVEEFFKDEDESFFIKSAKRGIEHLNPPIFGSEPEGPRINRHIGVRYLIFKPEQFRKLIFRIYWDLFDKFKKNNG